MMIERIFSKNKKRKQIILDEKDLSSWKRSRVIKVVYELLKDEGFTIEDNKRLVRKNGFYMDVNFFKMPSYENEATFQEFDIAISLGFPVWSNEDIEPKDDKVFLGFMHLQDLFGEIYNYELHDGEKWDTTKLYEHISGPFKSLARLLISYENTMNFLLSDQGLEFEGFYFPIINKNLSSIKIKPGLNKFNTILCAYSLAKLHKDKEGVDRSTQVLKKYALSRKEQLEEVKFLLSVTNIPIDL